MLTSPDRPSIESKSDEDLILDLLYTLLSPIGDYRRFHISPTASKGKRRRRESKKVQVPQDGNPQDGISTTPIPPEPPHPPRPPPPDITKHILVGLNSITSYLTSIASSRCPPSFPEHLKIHPLSNSKRRKREIPMLQPPPQYIPPIPSSGVPAPTPLYLTTIFLTHADSQPTALRAHLPMLAYLASHPTHLHPTLLVPLPKCAAEKLSNALGIPSVNFVALWSTIPEVGTAGKLLEVVRKVVKPVKIPWLDGAEVGEEEQQLRQKVTRGFSEGSYRSFRVKKLRMTIGGKQTVADLSK